MQGRGGRAGVLELSAVSGRKSFPNRKTAQRHSLDSGRAQERKKNVTSYRDALIQALF